MTGKIDTRTSAQRYVDILTEAGFEAVFGVEKNKDVLVGLLNTGVPKFDRSDGTVWKDRYVSEYTFREKISHEVVDETIFLNFVELDRFDKELGECGSMSEKWFYSLKHMGRMDRMPEELRVKVFERLFEACEIARCTPEEKLEYEHDMITERDYTNILNTYRTEGLEEGEAKGRLEGKAEGMAEGLVEGEARGKAKGLAEVARAMKAKGLGMALIAELTGLPEEEIRKS